MGQCIGFFRRGKGFSIPNIRFSLQDNIKSISKLIFFGLIIGFHCSFLGFYTLIKSYLAKVRGNLSRVQGYHVKLTPVIFIKQTNLTKKTCFPHGIGDII